MRGVYTANARITGITTAKTLMYITAPANKVVEILSAHVTNEDVETNEQARIALVRVNALGAPTDSAVTPAKHEEGDQIAASTVRANVTASEPTFLTNTEIGDEGIATLGGWHFDPLPEERPTIAGGSTLALRLLTTVVALNANVRITFREIG